MSEELKVTYKGKTYKAKHQPDGRLTSGDGKVFLGFGEGNLVRGAEIVKEASAKAD